MNCRLGWIIPFFGIIQFIAITFLAALSYPGGFNYLEYYLGDLGAEVAKNGEQNSISSALFSIALIIVAIALIPF